MENSPSYPPYNHTQFNEENTFCPSVSLFLCLSVDGCDFVLDPGNNPHNAWDVTLTVTKLAKCALKVLFPALCCERTLEAMRFMDFLFDGAAGDKWVSSHSFLAMIKVLRRVASVQSSWLLLSAWNFIYYIRLKALFHTAFDFPSNKRKVWICLHQR